MPSGMVAYSFNCRREMGKSLNSDEISKIKEDVKKFILKAEAIEKEDLQLIEKFKTKFTVCEKAYKIMEQKIKNLKSTEDIRLNLHSIKSNISKLNFQFDDPFLKQLFGSENKRNQKSLKKLRDALNTSFFLLLIFQHCEWSYYNTIFSYIAFIF